MRRTISITLNSDEYEQFIKSGLSRNAIFMSGLRLARKQQVIDRNIANEINLGMHDINVVLINGLNRIRLLLEHAARRLLNWYSTWSATLIVNDRRTVLAQLNKIHETELKRYGVTLVEFAKYLSLKYPTLDASVRWIWINEQCSPAAAKTAVAMGLERYVVGPANKAPVEPVDGGDKNPLSTSAMGVPQHVSPCRAPVEESERRLCEKDNLQSVRLEGPSMSRCLGEAGNAADGSIPYQGER